MSLFLNSDDRVHIERVNAEQMRKRGTFINVAPTALDDNGGIEQSEHQTASFIRLGNNLNISPGEQRRAPFTKTSSKVSDDSAGKEKTLPLHSNYANYDE